MIKVSPSLLSSSLTNLKEELVKIKKASADYAHVDCMDGHFVSNMAFGPSFVFYLKKENIIPLDVHLMIDSPLRYVDDYLLNSDILTIHIETINEDEFHIIEQKVHGKQKKLGISFRPNTPVTDVEKYLPYVDVVLIMSVMPGFSGQKFMPIAYDSIDYLIKKRKENNLSFEIEIDGGVDDSNYRELIKRGVDILVSGSYLFKEDMEKKIRDFKNFED